VERGETHEAMLQESEKLATAILKVAGFQIEDSIDGEKMLLHFIRQTKT
jgi:hypothetical protein